MAEHSGFFNALQIDGEYDRKYNANDYSENLSVVISNGVLRSEADDLRVHAIGLVPSVAVGRGWINGHWYKNDATLTLSSVNVPTHGARYDRVVLRYDNSLLSRTVHVVYLEGHESASPTKPEITRNDTIFDLVLADIFIRAGASTMDVMDMRANPDVCGWVYSTSGDGSFFTSLDNSFVEWFEDKKETLASVTLFKRYADIITLSSATSSVTFNIPQYDPETCFIEVFVNGIRDNRHTVNNNVLTFVGTLVAGTVISVFAYKSIDGTGIMDVADEITELQNAVAALSGVSNFTYKCTGLNDNIALSEIAQAFLNKSYTPASVTSAANAFLTALGGNTYLAGLANEAQITINVVGRLGATTPFAGSGTTESKYRWFSFGNSATGNMKIVFDFAKCEKINISCTASKSNIIFYGTDLYIRNANVFASCNGASCPITMIAGSTNSGKIDIQDCRFNIQTSGLAVIAENGTFTNCWGKVVSASSNAFCFAPKSLSLIRVIGGTYYAYCAASGMNPAIFYTYASETNAVAVAHNINCPTVSMAGYFQTYLSVAGAGNTYIDGVVSTMNSSGTYNTINGQIWKSKAN